MKKPSNNRNAKNYVNNKDLYNALVKYKEVRKEVDTARVPEYIGEAIVLITGNLSNRGNFMNYSYKHEMVSDAIENCLAAVNNFDVETYFNPHAYFTQIAWYAFIRRIDKEKRQNYLKYKNYQKLITEESLNNPYVNQYNPALAASDDVMEDVIRNYEDSIQRKKKKKEKIQGVDKFIDKE